MALYFTFDEGNDEMVVLKVAAKDAGVVQLGELSYYGGQWEGPMLRDEMLQQLSDFIVDKQCDDPEDDDEPNAAVLEHYTTLIANEETIEVEGDSVDVWDLRGEDADCGVSISRSDIAEMLKQQDAK
jgi:hypothetical protein